MRRKARSRQGTRIGKSSFTAITVVVTLLSVLIFTQILSAAQGGNPTPPAGTPEVASPYEAFAPTTEELLAMPPSIERYISAHTLPASAFQAADLDTSTKTASDDKVAPGGIFEYTITVANSGEIDIPAEVTDELPAEVAYIDQDCVAPTTTSCAFVAGEVIWEGTVPAGGSAIITIVVRVNDDAELDTTFTNTARIVSADQNIERDVDVTVTELMSSPVQFVPFTLYGLLPDPQPVTLGTTVPNGQNSWQLSWNSSLGATGYEIQESNDPNFGAATSTILGQETALTITKQPTFNNVFYYRVRSLVGTASSDWSNVVSVVGGYRDDFDDPSSGWAIRRGTNRDVLRGFYENGKYVTMITSRWDWLVASPLRPAPRVPYVIDFDARIVSLGYVHSMGAIFGGDWNGETCPPNVSFEQWPRHDDCFNHFYNTNTIYNDTDISNVKMGLLFERVDKLTWCPNCGGSPLKRSGDIPTGVRDFRSVDAKDWNHYRIEVRPGSIKVYAARLGQAPTFQYEYKDTRWIGDPYFGFFTSTDIIENATWRFDYMQVMPLD